MQRSTLRFRDGVEPFRGLPRTDFINCHEGFQPSVESGNPLQCGFHKLSGADCAGTSLLSSIDSGKLCQITHAWSCG
jgi:hypothetical protein